MTAALSSRMRSAWSSGSVAVLHWLEYGALWALTSILRASPLSAAVGFGGWSWRAVAPWLSRHRRAERHLSAMIPELGAAERQVILRGMWWNLGQTFVESLLLDRLAAEPECIELDAASRTLLDRLVVEGGIVVSPHLGNWEASLLPLATVGARHMVVYRRAKNPLVDAMLRRVRAPYCQGGIVAKGEGAAGSLMRQARRGDSIGIMADLRDASGVMAPFFGRPAPSTPMPAILARQFRRPLFAVCLIRVARLRFRMHVTEIEVAASADKAADIAVATARIQGVFEGWIRRWPEQWMWAHRRYGADV